MPSSSNEIEVNGVMVDTKKADKVLRWLVQKEAENVRTKALGEAAMIKEIQKKIKEETECY
ncbi:hypothetical protein FACS1894188_02350 [Clostridia bacterium]|nr:hypothetical protein FACS1894188_02350 [Clostridia bacterium]